MHALLVDANGHGSQLDRPHRAARDHPRELRKQRSRGRDALRRGERCPRRGRASGASAAFPAGLAVHGGRSVAALRAGNGGDRRVDRDEGRGGRSRCRRERRRRGRRHRLRARRRVSERRQRRRRRLSRRARRGQVLRARLSRDRPGPRDARHVPRRGRQGDDRLARRLEVVGRPRERRRPLGGLAHRSARGTRRGPSSSRPRSSSPNKASPVDAPFVKTIELLRARLAKYPTSAAMFLPGGSPPPVGATWRNPDLAVVLRRIADQGPAGLLRGWRSPRRSPAP